ncbi:hypothetical protein RYX45_03655 [Alkalihalophilus pseudofirmus]|uniref:Spore coat protein n=2 Tax=Alkalihalophilus pseudofirmus TaxID=79885 RepID=A0AAJ2KWE1_ALKPS|nr:hypothetical protein [Alkalihalophilus pseudofirmus]MDV2884260.1 hypothetical protein [Alkalihalophilus pseudofirmus]WEG18280.1 hypothetical protein PQ478_07310 [Alkalihalophilus pseudofirmus]
MMAKTNYAAHEVLEVHEMLTIKSASAAKSSMMQGLASDKKLKQLLQKDAAASQEAVKELRTILEKVEKGE